MTLTAGSLSSADMTLNEKQAVRIIRLLLANPGNPEVVEVARGFIEAIEASGPYVPAPKAEWTNGGAPEASPSPQAASRPQPSSDSHRAPMRGNAPFGKTWRKDSQGNRLEMVDDPRELKVLARISDLRKAGASYSEVVRTLNTEPGMGPRDAPHWNISTLRLQIARLRNAAQYASD